MDTYEKILVVILATALAVFLLLGIILLIKLMSVLNRVDRITEKAESVADKAVALGASMKKFSTPLMLGSFMAKKFKASKSKHNKRGENA